MRRSIWEFQYTGAQIAAAALKRAEYHKKREATWADELAKAEAAIKEKGFIVRENQITGGTRADVVIDQELLKRYNECWTKRREHKDKIDEYEGWHFVLNGNADAVLHLNHDDVLYFRVGDE